MTVELVRDALGWCAVIDYAVLLAWFAMFRFAHDWMYAFHGRWFALSPAAFDSTHYAGMGLLKLATLVFHLAPYLALRIVA